MSYKLDNPIVKRATKVVYKDNGNTIKLFNDGYSKANIFNEALNQARVEESTDLKISKLKEVSIVENKLGIVSEYICGDTLEDLMEKNPDKIEEYLNTFVDIQMEIFSKKVPLLNRMKDKYRNRISESDLFEDNIKYDLLQRLEGMKNHFKLCHGDFVPSNIIITENGEHYVIDWAHVTVGNASGDVALTYLKFCMMGKKELAEKYLDLYAEKSNTDKNYIQQWIPIAAAIQYTKQISEEKEILKQWIDVVEPQ
ncbi:MAG: phosphotransferase [Clostridia bacterium]|nr:phosphotransferase [Clostridia bacterium]